MRIHKSTQKFSQAHSVMPIAKNPALQKKDAKTTGLVAHLPRLPRAHSKPISMKKHQVVLASPIKDTASSIFKTAMKNLKNLSG
jgi:hypothetical protein